MPPTKDERLDLIMRQLLKLASEYRAEGVVGYRQALLEIAEQVGDIRDQILSGQTAMVAPDTIAAVPAPAPPTPAPIPSPTHTVSPAEASVKPRLAADRFHGKGIGEAARDVIVAEGRALRVSEIWEHLLKSGFEVAHNSPAHAVYDGLKKRAKRDRDVIRLPDSTWDITTRYTREKLAEFRGASRSERTKAGIVVAQARGVRFGQPTKLTESARAQIERGIASGERIPHIAKRLKIAESTIRKYYKGEELTRLKTLGSVNPDPNGSGFN